METHVSRVNNGFWLENVIDAAACSLKNHTSVVSSIFTSIGWKVPLHPFCHKSNGRPRHHRCLFVFVSNNRAARCRSQSDEKRDNAGECPSAVLSFVRSAIVKWTTLNCNANLPSWINVKPVRTSIRDGWFDGSSIEQIVNDRSLSYPLFDILIDRDETRIFDRPAINATIRCEEKFSTESSGRNRKEILR